MDKKLGYPVWRLTISAMFLAVGLVLPFFTGQIPQIGKLLLPMHIPVLLCGFICGAPYGLAIGFILPLLRHLLFGMPVLLTAIPMAFELAAYGFMAGYCYTISRHKCIIALYRSLILAMLTGRIVWGVVQAAILGLGGSSFTMEMFLAGSLLNAIPGIILQLIFIPAVMLALHQTGLVKFSKRETKKTGE